MRQTRDLVRLSYERVDDRTLALDAPWFNTDVPDGASDSDVDEDASELESEAEAKKIGSGADDGDSEEDSDDAGLDETDFDDGLGNSEEDEVEVPQSSARKRKRLQQAPSSLARSSKSQLGSTTRPQKKVAFAVPVKVITNSTRPSSSLKDYTLSRPSPYKKSNTKAPPPPSRTRKSAANAPPPTAQRRKPEVGKGEDDAYDFRKFF